MQNVMADPDTFVLLRGLIRERRHWGGFPQQLNRHFPQARILTPDLPGCGKYNQSPSPSSIPEMCERVRTRIHREIMDSKNVCLIALSMGAMMGIEWMTRYSNDFQSAVLINTSLNGVSPFYQRLQPKNYGLIAKSIFSKDRYQRESLVYQLTVRGRHDRESIVQQWCEIARERPVSNANFVRQLLASARYAAPKSIPKTPILLLASQYDRLVNVRCSQQLAKMWNLSLEIHDEAGHDLPLDDGEWCCHVISQWRDAR